MKRLAAAVLLSMASLTSQSPADVRTLATQSLAQIDGEVKIAGLEAPVSVVRDTWGVPHITARSTDDLFFAQGFVMAQDRLWQMEMWRRAGEGRMAEIAGTAAVARDRVARLLEYRGPFDDREWTSYHPEARRIFTAYVNGVNAYIAANREHLPIEFVVTGIRPEPWTIEQLVLRPPSFGDAAAELQLARNVARLGVDAANRAANPDPPDDLRIPDGLDPAAIDEAVVAAVRGAGAATLPPLLPQFRTTAAPGDNVTAIREPGSNNWVVGPSRSATGHPVVANDPHREVTNPSLRYIVHLQAPGWNVVGAGEPPFVGVALGHNERLAWGLTIVGTDQEDVYVEQVNPANANEVRYNGAWEPLKIVKDTIKVKGGADQVVELKFSRHGPIFYEDAARHLAYAVRRAAAEPGTAPYLAGLRLAQARTCRDFLDAATYWKAPTENLVCGDVDDNISWRPAALSPSRKGWTGRLPVPGTGAYEWQGFRDLPSELNPARGYITTANNNINPPGYTPPLMFKNADTRFERITRLRQLLEGPPQKLTLDDHRRMQHDAYSLRAAADLALFRGWTSADPEVERLRTELAGWDAVYTKDSRAAALYETWRAADGGRGRGAPPATRETAEARLKAITASGAFDRRWGQQHTRAFRHPLLPAFDLAPVERSGGAGTVEADGATYREILDVSAWDRSLAINVPGQSGQPGSPYYDSLLGMWAANDYFPLVFSSKAVASAAAHTLTITPR